MRPFPRKAPSSGAKVGFSHPDHFTGESPHHKPTNAKRNSVPTRVAVETCCSREGHDQTGVPAHDCGLKKSKAQETCLLWWEMTDTEVGQSLTRWDSSSQKAATYPPHFPGCLLSKLLPPSPDSSGSSMPHRGRIRYEKPLDTRSTWSDKQAKRHCDLSFIWPWVKIQIVPPVNIPIQPLK